MVLPDLRRAGQAVDCRPLVWLPEVRALERLGTVQEASSISTPIATPGNLPSWASDSSRAGSRVRHATVQSQRLLQAGDQEQQACAAGRLDVLQGEHKLVAGCVRDRQAPLVEHLDEARVAALGRDVAAAPASAVATSTKGERAMKSSRQWASSRSMTLLTTDSRGGP